MKLPWLTSLLLPCLALAAPEAKPLSSFVRFHLEWKLEGVPLRPRVFVAPVGSARKSGTTEVIGSLDSLGRLKELENGLLPLQPGEAALVYLVMENKGSAPVTFAVAPHETLPAASALGFHFQCLCNGTTYKVPPGKLWVRVLSLRTLKEAQPGDVTLRHVAFRP